MIGVLVNKLQENAVEEFFELFKTPWEFYQRGHFYDAVIATTAELPEVDCKLVVLSGPSAGFDETTVRRREHNGLLQKHDLTLPIYGEFITFTLGSIGEPLLTGLNGCAALKLRYAGSLKVHLGYDLFEEVRLLLTIGQPVEHAQVPSLDLHIQLLREWMLDAGIAFLEVLPTPVGHNFIVCLTHDIDFIGIRQHLLDHSMLGFLYRATIGSVRDFMKHRIALSRMLKSWRAVVSLPFVFAGLAKDFWEPFSWYLEVERGLPTTYFLIPFKRRAGEKVPGKHASRRATAYDVGDLRDWTPVLLKHGCELAVHGIDAWHSASKGREERGTIAAVTRQTNIGIRMHWLLTDQNTPSTLEKAGFAFDSTVGYNDAVGYRAGTTQVFRPLGAQTLLELPIHIQDGALFYPQKLNLREAEADALCQALIQNAGRFGGVLTLLWHDRSHGPERFWGAFYARLVQTLKPLGVWFGTCSQVVGWFRKRRDVRFESVNRLDETQARLCYEGEEINPPLRVRVYTPSRGSNGEATFTFVDSPWNGKSVTTSRELQANSRP